MPVLTRVSVSRGSLPGQLPLFGDEGGPVQILTAEEIANGQAELFYTGKDLPGAVETDQVILWDVF